MGTELKPCPFCGGKAEIRYQLTFLIAIIFTITARRIFISKEHATNDAIDLWNRRADNEQREAD